MHGMHPLYLGLDCGGSGAPVKCIPSTGQATQPNQQVTGTKICMWNN